LFWEKKLRKLQVMRCPQTTLPVVPLNEVITFTKDINGEILFAVEVRVNHGGWLSLITCYRLQKKDKAWARLHAARKRPQS
jgi:hypothetical protein